MLDSVVVLENSVTKYGNHKIRQFKRCDQPNNDSKIHSSLEAGNIVTNNKLLEKDMVISYFHSCMLFFVSISSY